MKILTINVIGIPGSSSSNLIEANVFQDYDAVVVDSIIDYLYSDISRYKVGSSDNEVMAGYGISLERLNRDRREQVYGLLARGGIVVCLMNPVEYVYYDRADVTFSISNYDWLLNPRELRIKPATGETINYLDSEHPFSEYLSTKPPWSAYIDKDTCGGWKILASAFGTHVVSLTKRVGLGHMVLLPSYYDHQNGELLERCIIRLLGDKETRPQPSWAKAILVPGQEKLISKITEVSDQIDALENQKKTLVRADHSLERWKYLLYEKGKHHLEPVVRDALALFGCNVKPQPDKDSDGMVVFEYGTALLEVVGSEGAIKIEKLGQLIKNIGNYISEKGGQVKGILVGNPFCDKPVDNRPPKDSQKQLFSRELVESAEQQSITVLLSTDLYEVVSRILNGELTEGEKQSLRRCIFEGKGLVKLS